MFQENEIAKLRRRLDEAEVRCAEVIEDNTELKREVSCLLLSPVLNIETLRIRDIVMILFFG